jgi:rhodanese-related sulfurtransferase
LEYRAKLIGVASLLLCVAFASQALTLGRISGAALIGQPLNMVVPVQTSPGEDASAACFEAEVFHADARQDPSRVKVAVQPTGQANSLNVRITSAAAIDEPVVTVYLRTLCDQKTTRRYVLLADFPSDVGPAIDPIRAPAVPAVAAPVANLAPALVAVPAVIGGLSSAQVTAPAPVAQAVAPAKPKPKVVKKVVKKPVNKAPVPKIASAAAAAAALPVAPAGSSGQPRLTLDSPLLLSEQTGVLTPPPGPSAEAQRDLLKIQTLESDVKALLALAAKNEANLLDLRTRLQAAESERLPNWIVYGLGALVLACLVVIALLLRRQRQVVTGDNSHWSASVAAAFPPGQDSVQGANTGPAPTRITMPGVLDTRQPVVAARSPVAVPAYGAADSTMDGNVTQVDVSLLEMSESGFDNLMQSGVAHSAIRKPQAQKPAAAPVAAPASDTHNLNSSTVFDVRQQAEFFVSLGQTDQAVRILEKHIADSDDPNPHVYLDLLAIFHSLSLKVDFRQFREDFNLLFNGRVPEFAAFKDEGQDLEAYPAVLQSISAVWPSAKVLTVIESHIFRDPWETGSQPFDLAAFRDLLLLHAVAQRILVASPGIAPSGPAQGAFAAALTQPYFADSGLSMPLPMPSTYASATDDDGLGLGSAVSGPSEVDLDLSFHDIDLDLDLDLSEKPGAAPAAAQDMDLDLSLPSSESMDLDLPDVAAPAQGNLIDFDISTPVQAPKSDDKTSS